MGIKSVLTGVLALVAAVTAPAVASARVTVVYAGGPLPFQAKLVRAGGATFDGFLGQRVIIHVGDTVDWNGAALAGGFHTVDIPAFGKSDLPLITPTSMMVGQKVVDAAGNPFWFDGKVPFLSFDPLLARPIGTHVYNGGARIDSGLPFGPAHDFKVKFTRAGVYRYFCDVHPGMIGYVVVKAKSAAIPTRAQYARALAATQRRLLAAERRLAATRITGNRVSLGVTNGHGLEVLGMFPATLRVARGTTVTFFMPRGTREAHTATFGPVGYLTALSNGFRTPILDPRATYPSSPGAVITLTPRSHGNGFANTGALDADSATPLPAAGRIDFTKPGTYHFVCLIHPFMRGVVIVR